MSGTNKSNRAVAFVGVFVGLTSLALYGVFSLLQNLDQRQAQAEAPQATTTVIVAQRTLGPGVPITADDIVKKEIPTAYIPRVRDPETGEVKTVQIFDNVESVIGQVPLETILPSEFVRARRLADGHKGQGLNAIVEPGMRAFSLGLSGSDAVAGFLEPGCFVDVLVQTQDERGVSRTETLLQTVPVLAVNSRKNGDNEEDGLARGGSRPSVTFLVKPEQAEQLALAEEVGDISLTLRNMLDETYAHLEGADLDRLLDRLKPKVEPKPVKKVRPVAKTNYGSVSVIRGGTRETVVVVGD